jgi:hypothetical protein
LHILLDGEQVKTGTQFSELGGRGGRRQDRGGNQPTDGAHDFQMLVKAVLFRSS